jgi:hypothetical protein
MKVNFFTPLPPAPTDIAMCAARFAPALAGRADVTFWTDQKDVDDSVCAPCRVKRYAKGLIDWRELNYADLNIYNVGNDVRFHASIMDVAHECPGVVIMHDVCIHELLYAALVRNGPCSERYLALVRELAPEGLADAGAFLRGEVNLCDISTRNPMTGWAVQGALGVVSHNTPALRAALPGLKTPLLDTPLPWLPHAQMPPPHAHPRGYGRLEMIVCGYLNSPNRRLFETLEALAAFPRRSEVLLHIAGRVSDAEALNKRIRDLGLERIVKLHGFMTEKALGDLIERAHLGVNLRWPSMGEASGSQLRYWNHSLPSIATGTGWYERQPTGSLLLADPQHEKEDLHRHWNNALDDYAALTGVGLKGRAVLEERHSAETFAEALVDFLPAVAQYRRRAFVSGLAARAGRALGGIHLPDEAAALAAASAGRAVAGIAGIKSNNPQ